MNNIFDFEAIFYHIKIKASQGRHCVSYPKAIILGGQPGAGKSALYSSVSAVDDNYIFINGDSFKSYHPDFSEAGYSYEVQIFSNRVVERLIAEFSDEGYNLVIEGTMRNVEVPLRTAGMLLKKNYSVEAYIVATDRNESWKNTLKRAKLMEERGLIPRYVGKDIHDEAADKLPKNVKMLCESGMFFDIVIMNREREELYRLSSSDGKDPEQVLYLIIHASGDTIS